MTKTDKTRVQKAVEAVERDLIGWSGAHAEDLRTILADHARLQEEVKPWRPGTEAPAVEPTHTAYFIVAVRRASSGLIARFPAQYLNAVELQSPDEDEPEVHTGWYCLEAEGDDPAAFYPTLGKGDELLGWCDLPDVPATLQGQQS